MNGMTTHTPAVTHQVHRSNSTACKIHTLSEQKDPTKYLDDETNRHDEGDVAARVYGLFPRRGNIYVPAMYFLIIMFDI